MGGTTTFGIGALEKGAGIIQRKKMLLLLIRLVVLFESVATLSRSSEKRNNIEFLKSAILKTSLIKEDFETHLKVLPDDRNVVFHLKFGEEIKLVYPVADLGPLSLVLSPCSGALKWALYLRPHQTEELDASDGPRGSLRHSTKNESSSTKNIVVEEDDLLEYEEKNRRRRNILMEKGRRRYGVKMITSNFSTPDVSRTRVNFLFQGDKTIVQRELQLGGGKEPWLYRREVAAPGLYILQVQSRSQYSKFHAMVSSQPDIGADDKRELKALTARDHSRKNSLTLVWNESPGIQNLYCLVVSREKLYSSLCAARELRTNWWKSRDSPLDSSLMLGCTLHSSYSFPSLPHAMYYVTVWNKDYLIPIIQATVRGRRHRKVIHLKPGLMVPFTLTAGGQAIAKFDVRKTGKKLHVAALSCSGGVKVSVLAGKERVAAAKGKEALHLVIRRPPKAELTLVVAPEPPLQALYRVSLVAAYSARKLPIPRLPKTVSINSEVLNCSSVKIDWTKSPGGVKYCVILRRHPSGRPREIRPPIQCGWEHVIKSERKDGFDVFQCFNGTRDLIQERIITDLKLDSSFLVNVLVLHPITGKALSLAPTIVNLPSCSRDEDTEEDADGLAFV